MLLNARVSRVSAKPTGAWSGETSEHRSHLGPWGSPGRGTVLLNWSTAGEPWGIPGVSLGPVHALGAASAGPAVAGEGPGGAW